LNGDPDGGIRAWEIGMKIRTGVAALFILGLLAAPASAQTYPNKWVRWIVPFPAGGATDGVARFIAAELSARHGQQFIIENRGGANGSLGTIVAKDAAPDGYTLLTGSSGVLIINPRIYSTATYDATKDFAPIGKIAALDNVVVVSTKLAASGVKTLADLIRYAKANPGKLNFGSGGIGNGSHLAAELLKKVAGIDMVHIPYKGGNEANLALIAGDIDLICNTTPEALPLIRGGNAVPLAVMTKARLAGFPELPTVAEAGAPGAEVASWMSLIGPKGMPADIVTILSKDLQAILASDKAKAYFESILLTRDFSTPEELQALIVAEGPRYQEILRAAGITMNK
jgi:tripartite-type tricarboxylate transporter receptor subunit TctC